jgi:hypothetical protein
MTTLFILQEVLWSINELGEEVRICNGKDSKTTDLHPVRVYLGASRPSW